MVPWNLIWSCATPIFSATFGGSPIPHALVHNGYGACPSLPWSWSQHAIIKCANIMGIWNELLYPVSTFRILTLDTFTESLAMASSTAHLLKGRNFVRSLIDMALKVFRWVLKCYPHHRRGCSLGILTRPFCFKNLRQGNGTFAHREKVVEALLRVSLGLSHKTWSFLHGFDPPIVPRT